MVSSAVADFAGATTTVLPATDSLAAFVGGFVAAEGSFTRAGDPPTFRFAIGLGAVDTDICHELRKFFGCGRIHASARRQDHFDDEVQFVISSMAEHLEVTVPFMDAHLPESCGGVSSSSTGRRGLGGGRCARSRGAKRRAGLVACAVITSGCSTGAEAAIAAGTGKGRP